MAGVHDDRKVELLRRWTKYCPGSVQFLGSLWEDADGEALWDALHDAVHPVSARPAPSHDEVAVAWRAAAARFDMPPDEHGDFAEGFCAGVEWLEGWRKL